MQWKLVNADGTEFPLSPGENLVGRGAASTILIQDVVVSRNHTRIKVEVDGQVTVEDLKSANGTYVGSYKIPENTQYPVVKNEIIGFGWANGLTMPPHRDLLFRLIKLGSDSTSRDSVIDLCDESDEEEEVPPRKRQKAESLTDVGESSTSKQSHEVETLKKPEPLEIIEDQHDHPTKIPDIEQKIVSTPDNPSLLEIIVPTENKTNLQEITPEGSSVLTENMPPNMKTEYQNDTTLQSDKLVLQEERLPTSDQEIQDVNIKTECAYDEELNFSMKEEYLDEAPILLDSDSEDDKWFVRLSQSSPGKPYLKRYTNVDVNEEIQTLFDEVDATSEDKNEPNRVNNVPPDEDEDFADDIIRLPGIYEQMEALHDETVCGNKDEQEKQENIPSNIIPKSLKSTKGVVSKDNNDVRQAVMIDALSVSSKRRCSRVKDKKQENIPSNIIPKSLKSTKGVVSKDNNNVRQAVMIDALSVSSKRRCSRVKDKKQENIPSNIIPKSLKSTKGVVSKDNNDVRQAVMIDVLSVSSKRRCSRVKDNIKKSRGIEKKRTKHYIPSSSKLRPSQKEERNRRLKEIADKEKLDVSTSKQPHHKKKVRFISPAQVRVFEIEPGNQMKKTSMCKATFLHRQRSTVAPVSLEKRFLMKVLKWNVSWLEEQQNQLEPPPILPHAGDPMSMCHVFSSHDQYVHILTDLILLETWASISQAYSFKRDKENWLQMIVESLPPDGAGNEPPVPLTLSVNLTLPKTDKRIPRVGEIMIMWFASEQDQIKKFVYVHNIRTLPAPANNVNNFFTLSLYFLRTDKLKTLKPGTTVMGKSLDSIRNELVLIEAIEELKSSPLGPVILHPKPEHFARVNIDPIRTKWTVDLNPSQALAVETSVVAALGDQPSIQMIQGPPGTGKSCVICTTVMRYFYKLDGRRQRERGKVLICATSNTAVDELVLRLLKFRQELPSEERFRMVRVGREESMHPRAQNISSTTLAKRDVLSARQAAQRNGHAQPGFSEEIAHLEMRVNTYRGSLEAAVSDPARAAYLQQRLQHYTQRLQQVKAATGNINNEPTPGELATAERRVIECANIIVTTLSSAANHKLKCLKNRVELCIVDEAGQAIEPVTLIPLTLGIKKLTLIGDPKQLPGHTTSQRAKQFGLGESLFSRLSSAAESWPHNPVVLLNEQYRMHPAIADYPNRAFYDGQVLDRAPLRTNLPLPPYAMLFISSGDKGQGVSGANEMEAWGVARLVLELNVLARPRNLSLAVITPYQGHKQMILKCLAGLIDLKEQPIEVNTVDSFQGQERDIVVVSLARSQGVGFLHDAGRMNVMLTRAKHCLLICLNPHAMLKHNQWRTLIDDAKKRATYKYLPNYVCQPATADVALKNPILKIVRDRLNNT